MSAHFDVVDQLNINNQVYAFASLKKLAERFPSLVKLPYSLRVLLENLLRQDPGSDENRAQIEALASWNPKQPKEVEIAFAPARVLLQDFTGVPAVVDLAAMRQAMRELGGDPNKINPLQPVDLVIDHSVQIDHFASLGSLADNVALEYGRNRERYSFLRWGQQAFDNFGVVPPGTGICHQVNLEYLAKVVQQRPRDGQTWLFPDSLVGTDSHTPMVNGLGVLGWGVGGIEAEAAMLGQPLSMLIPDVIGLRLVGQLAPGSTATDLVLRVVELLRAEGVVGKFVEYFGPGLASLPLADRATISNMTPEFGATAGYFPVDSETLRYMAFSNRSPAHIALVEAYLRAQGLFVDAQSPEPQYTKVLQLDLASVVSAIAGPKRPQDRIDLSAAQSTVRAAIAQGVGDATDAAVEIRQGDLRFALKHGAVVIASITSCTNTSNPSVMLGAGLLAQKAVQRGLQVAPWVKTSLAPGSKVVSDYLDQAGLTPYLQALGFHVVGYGCTTCIGNSGPLPPQISQAIEQGDLHCAAVLSGNRNFEGRVSPQTRLNFLASPPLVVAYALAGRADIDFANEPIGIDANAAPVYLHELWPSLDEIRAAIERSVKQEQFAKRYAEVFSGDANWQGLDAPSGAFYAWEPDSTYVRLPPFFANIKATAEPLVDIKNARVLALLGDSVTTDHISPAGNIAKTSPAATYLREHGVNDKDFNSYGSRRGNHEVMMRGTYANIRLRNGLVPGVEGGVTRHLPSDKQMPIYDAAMRYQNEGTPLVILAGAEYGTGSSRDWAAKGTRLLGVRAVIAKSFERIHRSNLVGMGVLPLQFTDAEDAASLSLSGKEFFSIKGLAQGLTPGQKFTVTARSDDGKITRFSTRARVDTPQEVEYFKHGGILHYVLRQLAQG